jgi:hypothetical protein
MRPSTGSISRVSSLAKVVLPEPVSPTTAILLRGGDPQRDVVEDGRAARVGEGDVLEGHIDGTARQLHAVRTRVGHVGFGVEDGHDPPPARDGVLRVVQDLGRHLHGTDEQRHQEQERDQAAFGEMAVHSQQGARDDHPGRGQGRHQFTRGEGDGDERLGPGLRLPVVLHRCVDLRGGTPFDAVRTDHRRAHHRLADRAEQVADPLAGGQIGGRHELLEAPQGEQQRQEDRPDQQRQRPGVVEHQRAGHDELTRGDDEHQAARLHEVADLVDVGGDPGHHPATPLPALGQHRQVVDVPEALDPQPRHARLAGDVEADVHEVRADRRRDHARGGQQDHGPDEGDVGVAVGGKAAVHRLLYGHGHDDPADGGDQGEQQGARQAPAELGAQRETPAQRRERRLTARGLTQRRHACFPGRLDRAEFKRLPPPRTPQSPARPSRRR